MAKNYTAYEAIEIIYGDNKELIAEVGSRFPLLTRTAAIINSEYLLDMFAGLPKVTARMVESGMKDVETEEEAEDQEQEEVKETKKETKVKKETKKAEKKTEPEEDEETTEDDYESMTSAELYKLCCKRGISGKVKSRSKANLIKVLKENESGETEPEEADDWNEEAEEEDAYAGKTAKELYKLCVERKISTEPRQKADAYIKLLKKADAKAEPEEQDEDEDDDEWNI